MNASNYLTEFPDFGSLPAKIAALVADGTLYDQSWHNDACPSFTLAKDSDAQIDECRTLWVNPENPADREFPEGKRFILQYPGGTSQAFDSEAEAIAALLAP